MSHKTSLRVWDHSQTRGAMRCLMLALADFANDDGICWPGTAVLADKINEEPGYTDTLIKKCIKLGELDKHAGRGRGHMTRFAILCGLDAKAQERLKGVLQKGYSSTPFVGQKGNSSTPFEKRGTTKGVLPSDKRVTFPDANYPEDSAPETRETAIGKNNNHHDPLVGDDDGDRTLRFLEIAGVGAAQEFAHLPFDPMRADYENRIAAGQPNAIIVKAWRRNPPTKDYHYGQLRPVQSSNAPRPAERSRGSHNGSGQSDVKDPGWRQRLIAKAEAGEL